MITAVIQFYREDAHYLERIYKWMDRIGLEAIKARVTDGEARAGLVERFKHAQLFSQDDPWAERASEGVSAHEFKPMAISPYAVAAE
jgi:nitrite reductase (NADH) large subunit